MMDKCIGCVWSDVTMTDADGMPVQIYCLPHPGNCPKDGCKDDDELSEDER